MGTCICVTVTIVLTTGSAHFDDVGKVSGQKLAPFLSFSKSKLAFITRGLRRRPDMTMRDAPSLAGFESSHYNILLIWDCKIGEQETGSSKREPRAPAEATASSCSNIDEALTS